VVERQATGSGPDDSNMNNIHCGWIELRTLYNT
jgi:hypothetical protein